MSGNRELEEVILLLRSYVDLVTERPESAVEINVLASSVLQAGATLQSSIADTSGWWIRLFQADEPDGEDVDGQNSTPTDVAIRSVVCVTVVDKALVLREGIESEERLWGPGASDIPDVKTAVLQLVHERGIDALLRDAAGVGLNVVSHELAVEGLADS